MSLLYCVVQSSFHDRSDILWLKLELKVLTQL